MQSNNDANLWAVIARNTYLK